MNKKIYTTQFMQVGEEIQAEAIPPPDETRNCNFCFDMFWKGMPHVDCARMHPGHFERMHPGHSEYRFHVCQPCFFQWIHGEVQSDNVGFRKIRDTRPLSPGSPTAWTSWPSCATCQSVPSRDSDQSVQHLCGTTQ